MVMTTVASTEVDFFRANGYLHLSQALAPGELQHLQRVTDRIIDYANTFEVPDPNYSYRVDADTGRKTFFRLDYAKRRSVAFQALLGHPVLLNMFESLLGPNFIVLDDSLVVKTPGSGVEFPWHRDTVPGRARAGDAVLVPGIDLDASTIENGCVNVIPGTNNEDVIDLVALRERYGWDVPGAVPIESQPGDILAHAANTVHGSRPSQGGGLRRTIYVAAIGIDEYLGFYEATPDLVRMQMRYMTRALQLRRTLDYVADEQPYEWKGDEQWRVQLDTDDWVEWSMPASSPAS